MLGNKFRNKVLIFLCLLIFNFSVVLNVKAQIEENTDSSVIFKNILLQSISAMNDSEQDEKKGSFYGITKNVLVCAMPVLKMEDEGFEEIDIDDDIEEKENEDEMVVSNKKMNDDKSVKIINEGKPLVLIYHTHATESFKDKTSVGTYRSTDNSENMISVGNEMVEVLEKEYGIMCIHDTSKHDYPSYNDAYDNSLESAQKILKENPSIKYIFDIHRDGLPSSNNNEKYNTKVGSKPAARIMTVVGLNYKNSNKNVAFANRVEKKLDKNYPQINIGVMKREPYKYNQWLRPNSLLFEIGSNLNDLSEAKYSAKLLGRVIGEMIVEDYK